MAKVLPETTYGEPQRVRDRVAIGLLGLGTVGAGVFKALAQNGDAIAQKIGTRLEIKRVLVRDTKKDRGLALADGILTSEPEAILDDPEIDIVVELIGGMEPARGMILRALRAGKSVVTANKEVIAEHGHHLFEEAERYGASLNFEGSVGGGIPVIGPLKRYLAGNRVESIIAILNGTTNYILTRMTEEGRAFRDVLADAQAQGYAEADPTADIEGHDAARKLAILASIAFGATFRPSQVYTEGIGLVTPWDIQYAREMGKMIKLLAVAREIDGQVELRVHPAMIDHDHPLASVKDAFNAILVTGDPVGQTMFYGPGAGGGATASAVIGDIIDIVRSRSQGNGGLYCTCYREMEVRAHQMANCRYYLRLKLQDQPGVLARVAGAFGQHDISLHTVIQKRAGADPRQGRWAEIVLVTHTSRGQNILEVLKQMEDMEDVYEAGSVIRLEEAVG